MRSLIAAALAALLLMTPALAQSEKQVDENIELALGDPQAFHEAFDAIQTAIADDDAEALAAYIPIGSPVMIDGEPVTYDSAEQFVDAYDTVISPEIADAVAAQTYGDLFVSGDGVMIGNGEVWLNGICRDDKCAEMDVKIVTIQSTTN